MPKISALPLANSATTGDLLVLDQGNVTKSINFNVLQSAVANAGVVQSLINQNLSSALNNQNPTFGILKTTGPAIFGSGVTVAGPLTIGSDLSPSLSLFSQTAVYPRGTIASKVQQYLSVKDAPFNAKGDGVTDDTSAFVAAIAYASSLWVANGSDQYSEIAVLIPDGNYVAGGGTGIVIASGVVLMGIGRAKVIAASTGIMFTDSLSNSSISPGLGGGLINLQLHGLGAATPLVGLVLNYVQNFRAENCRFDNFADQAIHVISGNTNKFRDVISFNCVINTARGARAGQFEIGGTDHEFTYCEAFNSLATRPGLSSASKFCVGWWIKGTTNRFIGCKGSVTDQGFYLDASSSNNHYIGCRADADYAEGVYNDSSANLFIDLEILDCGQGTNNTYDVYTATVNTQNNVMASASIFSQGATANKPRYGIADANNTGARPNRYNMAAILVFNAQTGTINNSGGTSIFGQPQALSFSIQNSPMLYAGSGLASNALGANFDVYLRGDGGLGSTMFVKRLGSWTVA